MILKMLQILLNQINLIQNLIQIKTSLIMPNKIYWYNSRNNRMEDNKLYARINLHHKFNKNKLNNSNKHKRNKSH